MTTFTSTERAILFSGVRSVSMVAQNGHTNTENLLLFKKMFLAAFVGEGRRLDILLVAICNHTARYHLILQTRALGTLSLCHICGLL